MWESFEEAIRDAYDYLRPKRTRTWSTNDGQQWVKSDDRLPPTEESLIRKGSTVHGKSQVETEGELKNEPKARQMMDDEEVASQRLRANDLADMKTEVRYDDTTSREEEGFGKQFLETSGNEGVSINEAMLSLFRPYIRRGEICKGLLINYIQGLTNLNICGIHKFCHLTLS